MSAVRKIVAGSKVRFEAPLSNGATVQWTAVVVKIEDGVAFVRHPKQARAFPFSPVAQPGLYKYRVEKLLGSQ